MESKNTLACPVEEDLKLKTSKEESSKAEENQSELVVEGGETLPPFEPSVTKGSTDDTKLSKETNSDNQGNAGFFPAFVAIYFLSTHYVKAIWYLMSGFLNVPHGPATRFLNRDKPRSNRPLYWWNQRFKGYKPPVGIATLFMLVTIPGVLGQCGGNGDVCLSLAQKGPDWFNKIPECLDVRCLDLLNGQHNLLQFFSNLEELHMNDTGNITIPCDVLKNLSNLHKINLHVKNIPTVVCNTSCVLSEVTVAVLHNTSAIPCNLTEWMPNLKSFNFENDQSPTSVPPGIISEKVTTTAANMVNQEKDAGFGVGFLVGFVVCAVIVGVIVIAFVLCRSNKHQSCSKCPSPVRNGVSKTSSV